MRVNGLNINTKHIRRSDIHLFYVPGHRNDFLTPTGVLVEGEAEKRGFTFTSLEFSGWGDSDGEPGREGYVRDWFEELKCLHQNFVKPTDKVILVGLSMGGWLAVALAKVMPNNIKGIVGISAGFGIGLGSKIKQNYGKASLPLGDMEMIFGLQDSYVTLDTPLEIPCPVKLRYGMSDPWVPKETGESTIEQLKAETLDVMWEDSEKHTPKTPEDMTVINEFLNEITEVIKCN